MLFCCISLQWSQHERKKEAGYVKKPLKIVLTVLCIVFVCVFVFSGYKLYSTIHEYKVAEKMYNGLSGQFVTAGNKDKQQKTEEQEEEREISPISVDFETLLAQNEDVAGWIYSAETPINYPVAKAEDNFYYLHRFLDGSYNASGTLFMDCLCEKDFSNRNSLIYGHNMNDGSMFASLKQYNTQEYYDQHPVMYLNTPTQNYRIELFAGYVTDADSDTYTIGFTDDAAYQAFLEKMKSQSDFSSNVEVGTEDKIVTLSTCSYEYYDARYVVQGKLVPIN